MPDLLALVDELTRELESARRSYVYERSTNFDRDLATVRAGVNQYRERAGLPPLDPA